MENKRIYLSLAHMGGDEQDFIKDAFDTNWIAPLGPNVDAFEKDISRFLDRQIYVAALNAGTSALHLGLILLGVKAGDEVICQSLTFSASVNPIIYQGATPVFIDSEKDTWNMSPQYLEFAIKDRILKGKKPKAIIPVHLYGMPAKMDEIISLSRKYEIPILEDSAEALGSKYRGKCCGTLGNIAALSFNGNKIITTSGGGALISYNEDYVKHARFLATQARDIAPHYQHSQVGFNYRLSNVLAGIGRGQMMVLLQRIEQRRKNNEYYRKNLADISCIRFQTEPTVDFYSNYWLTSILIHTEKYRGQKKEDLISALNAANIESRPLWKPMHQQPVFENYPYYGEGICDRMFECGLCLPSGSNLSKEDLDKVIDTIKNMKL